MKTIFKSLSVSVLALVMVVTVTTAAGNVKKFTEKVIARSLTVQQDLLVKGNLTVEGNFDPQTISDVLGDEESTWTATIYDIDNGTDAVADDEIIKTTEYLGEKLTVTFTPSSANEGTLTTRPLNVFFRDGGGDDYTDLTTLDGEYVIVGTTMYVMNASVSKTEDCLEDDPASTYCYHSGAVTELNILPNGNIMFARANEDPEDYVILEPVE